MAKKKPVFIMRTGNSIEDLGVDYDIVVGPCNVCVYEDRCLGTSSEDENICDLAQAYGKLFDEFNEKVKNLVKEHG